MELVEADVERLAGMGWVKEGAEDHPVLSAAATAQWNYRSLT
jgi:hypothetical protein